MRADEPGMGGWGVTVAELGGAGFAGDDLALDRGRVPAAPLDNLLHEVVDGGAVLGVEGPGLDLGAVAVVGAVAVAVVVGVAVSVVVRGRARRVGQQQRRIP